MHIRLSQSGFDFSMACCSIVGPTQFPIQNCATLNFPVKHQPPQIPWLDILFKFLLSPPPEQTMAPRKTSPLHIRKKIAIQTPSKYSPYTHPYFLLVPRRRVHSTLRVKVRLLEALAT